MAEEYVNDLRDAERASLFLDTDDNKVYRRTSAKMKLSGLNSGGQDTIISILDSTWTKLERSLATTPTGAGILAGRNSLKITNKSNVNICTTINVDPNGDGQSYEVGDEIFPSNSQFLDVAEKRADGTSIDIWVRSLSGSATVFFREIA